MNRVVFMLAILAAVSISSVSMAQRPNRGGQDGGRRGGGERGQRGDRPRPISPLMAALDVDKDGKLSAEEIAGAAKALRTLDKNSDGSLDVAELTPQREGRQGGGPGGQRGGGGRGGFGDPSAMVDRIMERDTDEDGKVSKEEAGERMAAFFGRMDSDKDGFLTRKEVEDMAKQFSGGGGGSYRGSGRGQPPKSKDNRPAFDDN